MNVFTILFLSIFTYLPTNDYAENIIDSRIEEVIVNPSSAQIKRRTELFKVKTKNSDYIIRGLSPFLRKEDALVKLKGNGVINSVKYRRNFMLEQEFKKSIVDYESRIKFTKDSIEQIQLELKALETQRDFLHSNKLIKGDNAVLGLKDFKEVSSFYRDEMKSILLSIHEKGKMVTRYNKILGSLQHQLTELRPKSNEIPYDAIVRISAKNGETLSVELSYQVTRAGWYSSYDCRVKSDNEHLTLIHKANVYQQTGEDWSNVILSFSNEEPLASKNFPVLKPIYVPQSGYTFSRGKSKYYGPYISTVSGYITDREGLPLIGANVLVQGTKIGVITDIDGHYNLSMPAGHRNVCVSYVGYNTKYLDVTQPQLDVILLEGLQLEEIVVTGHGSANKRAKKEQKKYNYTLPGAQVTESSLSFRFTMNDPYSILNDSKNNEIVLRQINLNSIMKYRAAPKLSDYAFLTAYVENWEDKKLLRGNMNLYLDDTYVGKSLLDPGVIKDKLEISLGTDSNILVKSDRKYFFRSKKFFSGKQKTQLIYHIKVKNQKKQDIQIEVWDQIPVSTDKEIKVNPYKMSPDFQLNKDTGIGRWNMIIKENETIELDLGFELSHPKHYVFRY